MLYEVRLEGRVQLDEFEFGSAARSASSAWNFRMTNRTARPAQPVRLYYSEHVWIGITSYVEEQGRQ